MTLKGLTLAVSTRLPILVFHDKWERAGKRAQASWVEMKSKTFQRSNPADIAHVYYFDLRPIISSFTTLIQD